MLRRRPGQARRAQRLRQTVAAPGLRDVELTRSFAMRWAAIARSRAKVATNPGAPGGSGPRVQSGRRCGPRRSPVGRWRPGRAAPSRLARDCWTPPVPSDALALAAARYAGNTL